ncbi:MAG: hypothetical protein B0D92_04305 [Spirochaeta sp. LUC14_002_19_P3]|nr:MAG: hypothetical protein B0D92_04305 [Spirochaeta sp. LUC14_002_19_P3]
MFDNNYWIVAAGSGKVKNLTLFSLTTCVHCVRARGYLSARKLAFRYLDMDTIPKEDKLAIKNEFKEKFGKPPAYPSLVLNDSTILVGFNKQQWEKEIYF